MGEIMNVTWTLAVIIAALIISLIFPERKN